MSAMTTTTATSLSTFARAGADLFDQAERFGLPLPHHITVNEDGVTLILSSDEGKGDLRVMAWAKRYGLEVKSTTREQPTHVTHFVDARGEVEGVNLDVTTNWRTPRDTTN